jgi:probable phosphoglycerate mutase
MNNSSNVSSDRIRGWKDVPLDKKGVEEANQTGKKLKNKEITHIFSSDLKRAKETADIIGGYLKLKPKYLHGLRPWDLGELTGTSTKTAIPKIKKYVEDNPGKAVPKGESFESFRDRALDELTKLFDDYKDKTIAVVTHHRVERLFNAWLDEGKPKDYSINLSTFTQKGEPPASFEKFNYKTNKESSLRTALKKSIQQESKNHV